MQRLDGTPFDRPVTARPLLTIIVSVDEIEPRDRDNADRVVALQELSFIAIIPIAKGASLPPHDLIVRSVNASQPIEPSGAVSPSTALDFVRVLLAHHGMFYMAGGSTMNEGFYYLYRSKSMFATYQEAWSAATFGKTSITEEVRNQLHSLGTRIDFLCRALDRGAHSSLREPNNDSEDNTLYHLAYFVMLATGMFDDLAWILNYLYVLQLSRMEVKLRIDPRRPAFLNALRVAAPALAATLEEPQLQAQINAFYPIRDRLQHRQFLSGLLYVGGPWRQARILFDFPVEGIAALKRASGDGTGYEWGVRDDGTTYVDPYLFLSQGFKASVQIHEQILRSVDWLELLGSKGSPERDSADESVHRWRTSPIRFFNLPSAPLYF